MELEINNKMRMIGIKSSQSFGIEVARNEIFSESQFKSFKHHGDNRYVKIISFVVFYTLLKIDKPYLEKLDEKDLDTKVLLEYNTLLNSDERLETVLLPIRDGLTVSRVI